MRRLIKIKFYSLILVLRKNEMVADAVYGLPLLSDKFQEEYKKALETGGWHRRLEFPGRETIVMHNANVIVQFPASSPPDEWGHAQVS